MSTTITGDNHAAQKLPGTTTQTTRRKKGNKRMAAGTKTTIVTSAKPAAPMTRKAQAKPAKAAPKARVIPIGISSTAGATDLLTGFIQSMPKAGTSLAPESRDACKKTFGALIDWMYPSAKAA